jgi:hypothetical protein
MFCGHPPVHARWVDVGDAERVPPPERRAARAMMVLHCTPERVVDLAHGDENVNAPWCNKCGLWMLRSLGRTQTRQPAMKRERVEALAAARHGDADAVVRLKAAAAAEVLAWAGRAATAVEPPRATPVAHPPRAAKRQCTRAPPDVAAVAPPPPDVLGRTQRFVSRTLAWLPLIHQARALHVMSHLLTGATGDEIEVDLGEVDIVTLHNLLASVARSVMCLRWRLESVEARELTRAWEGGLAPPLDPPA